MKKQRQRALQISLGLGMLVIVILVEVLAISPAGIYSYTLTGYRNFKIGAPRQRILAEINRVPAIRTLITCTPDSDRRFDPASFHPYTGTGCQRCMDRPIPQLHNVIIFCFKNRHFPGYCC